MEGTLLNETSNTTWNCGEISQVRGFKMRGNLLPWLGVNPTNTPFCDQGCHVGSFLPCYIVESRTHIRSPKVCTSFNLCRGNESQRIGQLELRQWSLACDCRCGLHVWWSLDIVWSRSRLSSVYGYVTSLLWPCVIPFWLSFLNSHFDDEHWLHRTAIFEHAL